ncbi:MAG: HAD-IA family hydrolase [Candidatus Omnitrophica bacterium]|nr:HAD-IA family hydrolase [Candidatus Omnitrophota bacterium]
MCGMIKGVIFDMDGVLVDSEPFISEAAIKMFAEHGLEVKAQDFIPFVGTGEDRYLGGVAQKYNFPIDIARDKARTYEIYAGIVKNKIKPLPGVEDFIERCRKNNLKLAVATSADKIKMVVNLKEIGIGPETFDAVINGLDVAKKKPHPQIFIKAAEKLGLLCSETLVVEDAVNGVRAAKVAGARCLGLCTSFSPEELGEADWTAPDLAHAPAEVLEW